jgi:hypothetical protein
MTEYELETFCARVEEVYESAQHSISSAAQEAQHK